MPPQTHSISLKADVDGFDLDRPFDGVIQISDAPLRNVLNRRGPGNCSPIDSFELTERMH